MSCAAHQDALLDAARGGALVAAAAAHVAGCAACADWLEEQRALSTLLAPLADDDHPPAPPLPAALRTALSARPRPTRRPAWLVLPAAAAAAIGWLALRAPEPPPSQAAALPLEPLVRVAPRTPAPSPEPVPAPAKATAKRTRRAPQPRPERATRFVGVPYAEAYGAADNFQLVRVEMPRSALVRYGWPAVRDPRPVTADVLVGSDGLARAIRLVETR